MQDLFGFSQPELIETIYNFKQNKIPILSAIGHQVDTSLLDLVADYTCATPSLASQFIINHNNNYIKNFETIRDKFKEDLFKIIYNNQKKVVEYNSQLNNKFNELNKILQKLKNNIYNELTGQKMQLNFMLKNIDNDNITLFDLKNNKIDSNSEIDVGEKYYLLWGTKKFRIKVFKEM
jgi:exodeoxyribonuclease VII large subunit